MESTSSTFVIKRMFNNSFFVIFNKDLNPPYERANKTDHISGNIVFNFH